jgi:CBS domain-containing protein
MSDPVSQQRVRDHMTSTVATTREDRPLEEVVRAFLTHPFHHMPVLDAAGKEVVGLVSDRDLLAACLQGPLDLGRPVGDLMSQTLVSVGGNATLALAAAKMIHGGVNSALVRGEGGAFLGILTARDLTRALAAQAELRRDADND